MKKYNLEDRLIIPKSSCATVELASQTLNCDISDIAKTMAFLVNEEVILIVMAGNKIIDNHKYKEIFHKKAKMLDFEDVEKLTVTPFGIKNDIKIFLDNSLKEHEWIYPAGGDSLSVVKIKVSELENVLDNFKWEDINIKN